MTSLQSPTLVQFGRLRRIHFDKAPVWVGCHTLDYDEPWYDETNEETFRPWNGPLPFDPSLGMAAVKADFQLADGTSLAGFVTPQPRSTSRRFLIWTKPTSPDLGIIQPHMFGRGGRQLDFWFGMIKPDESSKARFYAALGRTPAQVFPIHFAADPTLALGITSGTISGFCYIPDLKTPTFAT